MVHGVAALRFGPAVLEQSQATGGITTAPEYLRDRLRDLCSLREEGIYRLLAELRLDALAFLEGASIAAVAGYPSSIVPAGWTGRANRAARP